MNENVPAGWYPVPGGQRWWNGHEWTEHFAAAQPPVVAAKDPFETNHILHLLLTVFTAGLWAPVWLVIACTNSNRRARRDAPALLAANGLPPRSS